MIDRKSLIRQVHVLAYQRLKFSEEEYRQIVESVTGKRSVGELPALEIEKVLVALRRIPLGTLGGHHAEGAGRQHANRPQQGLIAHLMEYLGWRWTSTAKFCTRITGKSDTRACDASELRKVILGMIALVEQDVASGRIHMTTEQQIHFKKLAHPHRKEA
jgi:hypothetical protein